MIINRKWKVECSLWKHLQLILLGGLLWEIRSRLLFWYLSRKHFQSIAYSASDWTNQCCYQPWNLYIIFIQIPNQQNPACPGSEPRSLSQVIHERIGSMIRIVIGSEGLEMEWRLMFSFRLKTVWNVSSPPSTLLWTRSRVVFAWQTRHFSTRIFATMQSSEPSHVLKCCDWCL